MFNFFKKKKAEPKNLKEVLAQFKELEKDFERISQELEKIKKDNLLNIQKVGLVRFNPFSEVGGDQSFSLALLDAHNSGIVMTSLYTREGNRVYGKQIKKGESQYLLSDEEKQAIAQANEVSAGRSQRTPFSSPASPVTALRKMKTEFSANDIERYGNKNTKFSNSATEPSEGRGGR